MACLAVLVLMGAGLMSQQHGTPGRFSSRFHTNRKASKGSETAAAAFYQPQATANEAVAIDWQFLDRTEVKVSDGVHDAEINFPNEIRKLDGQRLSIVGQMNPWQSTEDFTQFVLTMVGSGCIDCSPPPVTLTVHVTQKARSAGGKPPFAPQPVRVTGVLRLFTFESRHPAHLADFLYALDDAVVEIAPSSNSKAPAQSTPAVFRRRK